jgi:hypothetical protein
MRTLFVLLCMGFTVSGASPLKTQDARAASAETAALKQFDTAIAGYIALRRRLADELPRPVPNSTAVELNNVSDALAAAIQRRRPNAGVGDVFVAPVTPVFKRMVDDAVRATNLQHVLAEIDDEEPTVLAPKIHLRFPAASEMATMPASLLAVLPNLPKELEYRIIGRFLVLRDIDAALIVDYIPDLIPR